MATAHRRDSLANKLLGILGSYGHKGGLGEKGEGAGSPKMKQAAADIAEVDRKASEGMSDELFKKDDDDETISPHLKR